MSQLILPPSLQREKADAEREKQTTEVIGRGMRFNLRLKEIDPYLELVFVHDDADAPGLVPGRWHVCRHNPDTMDTYMPITTASGGYREPAEDILEALRRRDLWNGSAAESIRREKLEKEEAVERARRLDQEQKMDHFALDYRAARRVPGENLHKKVAWR